MAITWNPILSRCFSIDGKWVLKQGINSHKYSWFTQIFYDINCEQNLKKFKGHSHEALSISTEQKDHVTVYPWNCTLTGWKRKPVTWPIQCKGNISLLLTEAVSRSWKRAKNWETCELGLPMHYVDSMTGKSFCTIRALFHSCLVMWSSSSLANLLLQLSDIKGHSCKTLFNVWTWAICPCHLSNHRIFNIFKTGADVVEVIWQAFWLTQGPDAFTTVCAWAIFPEKFEFCHQETFALYSVTGPSSSHYVDTLLLLQLCLWLSFLCNDTAITTFAHDLTCHFDHNYVLTNFLLNHQYISVNKDHTSLEMDTQKVSWVWTRLSFNVSHPEKDHEVHTKNYLIMFRGQISLLSILAEHFIAVSLKPNVFPS